MDTFSQLVAAVQSDATIDDNSSFITPDNVKLAVNRAYYKAAALHKWPDLEDSQVTSSITNAEYYDFPQNWFPESIWKLHVDGVDYGDPLVFKDYQYEKDNNFPSRLKYMWATQWRRYFIYPTPLSNGNNNIAIWGFKTVDTLVGDNNTTIFSYVMRDCNHAIVLEATRILKMKGEDMQDTIIPRVGEMRDLEAQDILNKAWNRLRMERQKFEKTQPMFSVPDYFSSKFTNTKNKIGDF
jgi:hypothetical protein